ncbi:alpha/beta fold hydrolase [Allosaccharopolyspora coralli]|uniref:Alpha/beta fold hydrolase n=1 Tax=Allosaccharopolyspora coralli TaxID=2665642 RepID=A0A5Q3QB15_9PSEU|nr:alpha/beta fold hydrolase [Allosaccharopolyspora coralli]QGK70404.1 alpha/beta fold hydrolase [Allosaccharopolyspora coralli]
MKRRDDTVRRRTGFAFAARGRRAVSVATLDDRSVLEAWDLTGHVARAADVPSVPVDQDTGVLPLDDGGYLLLRGAGTATVEIGSVPPERDSEDADDLGPERVLGKLPALGGYLLPSPAGSSFPGIAVVIGTDVSTVVRLRPDLRTLEETARIPGVLSGGSWLERDVAAFNRTPNDGQPDGIVVDVEQSAWRRTWSVSDTSADRIVLYAPATRLLVVSSNASGRTRLGWGILGRGTVEFPDVLVDDDFPQQALAVDERGERVLLHRMRGAVSELSVWTPFDGHVTPLGGPRGVVTGPVSWHGEVIHLPFSRPTLPPTIATVGLAERRTPPRWTLPRLAAGFAHADLVSVDGAQGPIEAVRYGRRRRREQGTLVVALHGGPLSAWRYEFDPLFQRLAAASVTVLAPNCRGSVGYGSDFSITGRWASADLDDVRALGRDLSAERRAWGLRAPILLGASYGAYLALLAACSEPDLWSGCIALAPFLSPAGLRVDAGRAVRERIDALGGTDDDRDVLRRCSSLRAPLMLVHGSRDERIPVEQSRALHRRLLADEATPVDYLEPDTDHAGVVAHQSRQLLRRIEHFCLTSTTESARAGAQPLDPGEGGERDGAPGLRHGRLTAGTAGDRPD